MTRVPLTIVSMIFEEDAFWRRNHALTCALNPDADTRWVLVDNSPRPVVTAPPAPGVTVVPGVRRPASRDRGSLHHSLGLEQGLAHAHTRFVLLLDPDFYVTRPGWIGEVLAHVDRRQIALFGSSWHPRWSFQYRGFPSVHFMLVDTDRIPRAALALRPLIDRDLWWRLISSEAAPLPLWLRETLQIGRIRDTGWQVYRRFRDDPRVRREVLVPHYVVPDTPRARLERRLAPVLPDRWRKYPADARSFTDQSTLRTLSREAYGRNWEEFFWQLEPFGFHLRRVGRKATGEGTEMDAGLLDTVLGRLAAIRQGG